MRRMTMQIGPGAAAVVALTVSLFASQARESTGTAVLSGVVLTDTSNPQPVRRATVRLSGAAATSTRLVGTDDEGRFTFTALPAGSYTLSALKPGFVQAFHGSSRPGRGPGVPVAIAADARVDVTLRMAPGAVITGTITDVRGHPLPGIAVHAVELRPGAAATARGMSDDRGVYRIFGLAPGGYLVSALPRLGSAAGRLALSGDVLSVSDAELQWARATGGAGAAAPSGAPPPAPGRPVAYAPVYYPGFADAAAAAIVKVGAGDQRAGTDMTVRVVPVATIGGTIVDHTGQPVTAATVSLFPRRRDRPAPADLLVSSGALVLPRGIVTATGFTIPGAAPGEYTLVARSGSGQRRAAPPPNAASGAGPLWSVTDLTVNGSDRSDLLLQLLPGVRLSGSIGFERSSATTPADPSAADLSLVAAGSYLGPASTSRAIVDAAGVFRFASIPPGTYLLRATMPRSAGDGASWTMKSAVLSGRDLADLPLEATTAGVEMDGLAITFTDNAAAVSGRLLDSSNRAVVRYSIVVFTTEPTFWRPGARRIQAVRPATDGSFSVRGLPAGEYAMAAFENLDAADLDDPAFLSRILSSAYKFRLTDGEQKHQDLKIARTP
jgi:uncharacterized protein (DUF2141 family)